MSLRYVLGRSPGSRSWTQPGQSRHAQAMSPLLAACLAWFPLVLILLLAVLLRFYCLSCQSLWSDEGNSAVLARAGLVEIGQRTAFDIHPPLYYWLLKLWTAVFGESEAGLRSLSAILGVLLTLAGAGIGWHFFGRRVALAAGLIGAVAPLQVYYAQEARMYVLLALLSTAAVWASAVIFTAAKPVGKPGFVPPSAQPAVAAGGEVQTPRPGRGRPGGGTNLQITLKVAWRKLFSHLNLPRLPERGSAGQGLRHHLRFPTAPELVYVAAATAGLYTHYAFPVVLTAINLAALVWLVEGRAQPGLGLRLGRWAAVQIIPVLVYAPWLPVAWRQISTWPNLSEPASAGQIALTTLRWLSLGLSAENDWYLSLAIFGLVLALGLLRLLPLRPAWEAGLLFLWLALPAGLTFFLFRPAYLKFLLVASPAFALLLALGLGLRPPAPLPLARRSPAACAPLLQAGALLLLVFFSGQSLANYYFDTAYQRDDYRGMAGFIAATAEPGDVVILSAPGQQEVFGYYDQTGLPIFPLPRTRPPDPKATQDELARISREAGNIYALFWATTEADPAGIVEGWLDDHAFKATDRWYGNVRLVSYTTPAEQTSLRPLGARFGEHIRLTAFGLPDGRLKPGRIVPVELRWLTDAVVPDYLVFVQLLDENNHLVGQLDARPQRPSSSWAPGEVQSDAHGLYLEPGTPPGEHRLIVGLYDPATGQRLRLAGSQADFLELAQLQVQEPVSPLPLAAFAIQEPLDERLGEIHWLGYDLYRLGHASDPDSPIYSGDPLHLVFYFRLDQPAQRLTGRLRLQVVTLLGQPTPVEQVVPLSGTGYSIGEWKPGEIVRAQFDLFLTDLAPGGYRLALEPIVAEAEGAARQFRGMTRPFRVE